MNTEALNEAVSPKEYFSAINQPGMTQQEKIQGYTDWSEDSKYDEDLREVYAVGHSSVAVGVANYLTDKKDAYILDDAAGTGLVAEKLRSLGFTNIDALDASEGMLEVARKKDLYHKYIFALFTSKMECLKTNMYDAMVCCCGFAERHLKCDVLPEMIRCVKAGGLVAIIMREDFLQSIAEYKDRLEPLMRKLQDVGKWMMLERTIVPGYLPGFIITTAMNKQRLDEAVSPKELFGATTRPGMTQLETIQGYTDWSKDSKYDEDFKEVYEVTHSFLADGIAKYLPGKNEAYILDVAAGTGLVAQKLRGLGFTNIDALDASKGMLEVARKKDLYQKYISAFFTNKTECLETNTYDAMVCCGGFAEGHMKCDALPEMICGVKTGGLVAIVMRENFFETVAEYKDCLEPLMKQLDDEGKWRC